MFLLTVLLLEQAIVVTLLISLAVSQCHSTDKQSSYCGWGSEMMKSDKDVKKKYTKIFYIVDAPGCSWNPAVHISNTSKQHFYFIFLRLRSTET